MMASICGVVERAALDLGANGIEAVRAAVAGVTVTRLPTGSAKRRKAGSARPISSGADQAVVVRDQQRRQHGLASWQRSSTRLKPRNTSGRSAIERRDITTTFSRPVSRWMRRSLSCGRAVLAMSMRRVTGGGGREQDRFGGLSGR